MFAVCDPSNVSDLQSSLNASDSLGVIYLWADFHPACSKDGQMDQVLVALGNKFGEKIKLFKINAEDEKFVEWLEGVEVSMVPTFVLMKKQQKVGMVEGVKPTELMNEIENIVHNSGKGEMSGNGKVEDIQERIKADLQKQPLFDKLRGLTSSAKVMVFMKGVPDEPKCKFSRELMGILKDSSIQFGSFNILEDNEVREGLKEFSNWKTYPQVYVNGKLVGGLDTIKQLVAEGELVSTLTKGVPFKPAESTSVTVNDKYLKELTNRAKVMLFMKGNPSEPKCGFSDKIVKILQKSDIKFESFDILEDQGVREGLKKFSNWPTYPQLYVNGELVGGLDIIQDMAIDGDLKEQLGIDEDEDMEGNQKDALNDRLHKLINASRIMIFIKGTPDEPRCGFSRQIVEILRAENCEFGYFDILTDDNVRQGLKDYSNWPTYPQLYVSGELVGGLDIVKEMKDEKELRDALGLS